MAKKDSIKTAHQEGMNAFIKYLATQNMQYPEIDTDCLEFFCDAQSTALCYKAKPMRVQYGINMTISQLLMDG